MGNTCTYYNFLVDYKPKVLCQSNDNDLGVHVLPNNKFFECSFNPSSSIIHFVFGKLQWGDKVISFDGYKARRDSDLCGDQCLWDVTTTDCACLDITSVFVGHKNRYGK